MFPDLHRVRPSQRVPSLPRARARPLIASQLYRRWRELRVLAKVDSDSGSRSDSECLSSGAEEDEAEEEGEEDVECVDEMEGKEDLDEDEAAEAGERDPDAPSADGGGVEIPPAKRRRREGGADDPSSGRAATPATPPAAAFGAPGGAAAAASGAADVAASGSAEPPQTTPGDAGSELAAATTSQARVQRWLAAMAVRPRVARRLCARISFADDRTAAMTREEYSEFTRFATERGGTWSMLTCPEPSRRARDGVIGCSRRPLLAWMGVSKDPGGPATARLAQPLMEAARGASAVVIRPSALRFLTYLAHDRCVWVTSGGMRARGGWWSAEGRSV